MTPLYRSPLPLFRNGAEVLGNLTSFKFPSFYENRGHWGCWYWENREKFLNSWKWGLDRTWYTLVLHFVPVPSPWPTNKCSIYFPTTLYLSNQALKTLFFFFLNLISLPICLAMLWISTNVWAYICYYCSTAAMVRYFFYSRHFDL